jgi:hypothetical protein
MAGDFGDATELATGAVAAIGAAGAVWPGSNLASQPAAQDRSGRASEGALTPPAHPLSSPVRLER